MKAILQGQKDKIQGEQGQFVGFNESGEMEAVDAINSFDGVKGEVVRNLIEEFYDDYYEMPDFINAWGSVIYFNTVESLGIIPGKDGIMVDIDIKIFDYQINEEPWGAGVYCGFVKSDGTDISSIHDSVYPSTHEGIWTHMNLQGTVPEETKYITVSINQLNRPFVCFGARNFNIKKLDDKKTPILPFYHPPLGISHRSIYRGKYLGTSVTFAQYNAINSGSFFDIFIGDYWVINGTKYIVADLDYWYNTGNTNFTKHHAVIVPESNIGTNKRMNSSDTTNGAYYGSEMYSTNLNDAKTKITADFGDAHILSHKILLENAVKDGYPSGHVWIDSKIDLMTETMVYGTRHYAPMGTGLVTLAHYTVDKTQLALFKLCPKAISTRQNYWLRDVVSDKTFADVYDIGAANLSYASATTIGIRPAFAIGV